MSLEKTVEAFAVVQKMGRDGEEIVGYLIVEGLESAPPIVIHVGNLNEHVRDTASEVALDSRAGLGFSVGHAWFRLIRLGGASV